MKNDIYALLKARILNVSEPGVWRSIDELVLAYNSRYSIPQLARLSERVAMHHGRMKRLLDYMVKGGYYLHDESRGYCFLTKAPKRKTA